MTGRNLLRKVIPRSFLRQINRIKMLERKMANVEVLLQLVLSEELDRPSLNLAFNGQRQRKRIFCEILDLTAPELIVETGTWLGNTAAYMARVSKIPVLTCEVDRNIYLAARKRVLGQPGVQISHMDSVTFLKQLGNSEAPAKRTLFYLDAHWYEILPLRSELELIASFWREFIVMIDDFKVETDHGYGYDVYDGRALDVALIGDLMRKYNLSLFFPAERSTNESGAKRGCAVIASPGKMAEALARSRTLVAFFP